jgi:hypothetical protein
MQLRVLDVSTPCVAHSFKFHLFPSMTDSNSVDCVSVIDVLQVLELR